MPIAGFGFRSRSAAQLSIMHVDVADSFSLEDTTQLEEFYPVPFWSNFHFIVQRYSVHIKLCMCVSACLSAISGIGYS